MNYAYPRLKAFASIPPLAVSRNEKAGSASEKEPYLTAKRPVEVGAPTGLGKKD
jgi:hypothetical protein